MNIPSDKDLYKYIRVCQMCKKEFYTDRYLVPYCYACTVKLRGQKPKVVKHA